MVVKRLVNRASKIMILEVDWNNACLETYGLRKFSIYFIRGVFSIFLTSSMIINCSNYGKSDSYEKESDKLSGTSAKRDDFLIYCQLISDLKKGDGLLLVNGQADAFSKIGGNIDETLKFVEKSLANSTLSPATIMDFKIKSETPGEIDKIWECNERVVVVEAQELTKFFKGNDGWESLRKKYPRFKSVITLSKIAFNGQQDQALVYMSYQNGEKSGAGHYFFLVKEKADWQIKGKVNVWES